MAQSQKTCLDPVAVEESLISAGKMLDPQQLLELWFQMRYEADQEAGLEAEQRLHEQRRVYLRQTWGGSFQLEGWLDAEGGCTLKTALDSLMKKRYRDDERTPGQRRADALTELARRQLDSGQLPERGGEKPHLMLVAELSTLRLEPGSKLAELEWGPLVSGETARRIGCDASITPVLVGSNGEILHVGRRSRSVPAPTRKALNLRDRRCQWAGCSMPAPNCSPHHLRHWADGGSDELDNLKLYCTYHHGLIHPENERYRTGAGRQPNAP